MIATEIKTDEATIRIHDEYCECISQDSISHLSQIITNSYKRRKIKENDISHEDLYKIHVQ